MPTPYEIFATGAVDIWLAPPNTADVVINVAPSGSWIKVGVSGGQNYHEDGVRIRKETENQEIYTTGSFGVRKVYRTREKLTVGVNLLDATIEAFRDAFNQSAITTLAGPPAEKTIQLLEGVTNPSYRALLVRCNAISPYMDAAAVGGFQIWVPVVYQTGAIEAVIKKSDPVGLELEFTAVADATNGFGKVHAQTS